MDRRFAGIAVAGLAVVLLLALIQFFGLETTTKYQRLLIDLGHVPLFAGMAIAIVYAVRISRRGQRSTRTTYGLAGGIVLVLALLSEALQGFDADRSVSFADLGRNVAGGSLGLIAYRLYGEDRDTPRRRLIALGASVSLLVLLPALWTGAAYAHRFASWPELIGQRYALERVFTAGYESWIEVVPDESLSAATGSDALLLRLEGCSGCGLLLQELAFDGAGMDALCLEFTAPASPPLSLSIRVGDSPMFFRSRDVRATSLPVTAGERSTHCLPLAGFTALGASPGTASFRSAAILLAGPPATAELLIHRVWFE